MKVEFPTERLGDSSIGKGMDGKKNVWSPIWCSKKPEFICCGATRA